MSEKATIKSWFIENHLDIDSNKLDKLMTYLEMIRDASKRMNLVSKNDLPHIIGRHFFPPNRSRPRFPGRSPRSPSRPA